MDCTCRGRCRRHLQGYILAFALVVIEANLEGCICRSSRVDRIYSDERSRILRVGHHADIEGSIVGVVLAGIELDTQGVDIRHLRQDSILVLRIIGRCRAGIIIRIEAQEIRLRVRIFRIVRGVIYRRINLIRRIRGRIDSGPARGQCPLRRCYGQVIKIRAIREGGDDVAIRNEGSGSGEVSDSRRIHGVASRCRHLCLIGGSRVQTGYRRRVGSTGDFTFPLFLAVGAVANDPLCLSSCRCPSEHGRRGCSQGVHRVQVSRREASRHFAMLETDCCLRQERCTVGVFRVIIIKIAVVGSTV